jgi:hypothetical protein
VTMAGTPAEYERMALKSIEKAAEDVSDTTYHLTRAQIFATLAGAAATEQGLQSDAGPARSAPKRAGRATNEEGERNLPAVRAS